MIFPDLVEGLVLLNIDPNGKGWIDWAASKLSGLTSTLPDTVLPHLFSQEELMNNTELVQSYRQQINNTINQFNLQLFWNMYNSRRDLEMNRTGTVLNAKTLRQVWECGVFLQQQAERVECNSKLDPTNTTFLKMADSGGLPQLTQVRFAPTPSPTGMGYSKYSGWLSAHLLLFVIELVRVADSTFTNEEDQPATQCQLHNCPTTHLSDKKTCLLTHLSSDILITMPLTTYLSAAHLQTASVKVCRCSEPLCCVYKGSEVEWRARYFLFPVHLSPLGVCPHQCIQTFSSDLACKACLPRSHGSRLRNAQTYPEKSARDIPFLCRVQQRRENFRNALRQHDPPGPLQDGLAHQRQLDGGPSHPALHSLGQQRGGGPAQPHHGSLLLSGRTHGRTDRRERRAEPETSQIPHNSLLEGMWLIPS
ncbi:hypothetical protein JZ751_005659 [Albula glossodonta]|uniref:Uncharacterized protein n=1 Tax=Albula glossodonta TaxID=121402 RepID=A0A8T2MP20_9TELE|nr:hypothetical protein JZ751_005659 [Albula glossodonta]